MPVLVLFTLSLAALMAGVAFGILLNRATLERRVDAEVAALFAELDNAATYVTEQEFEGLPAPVQRFVRRNLEIGSPHLSCARLRMSGTTRDHAGQPWSEFEAEEYVVASAPAMLWYARLRPYPLIWIDRRELLLPGRAHIMSKTLSTLALDQRDDDAARRAMMVRWLIDLVHLPSAALPREEPMLRWRAIADDRAEAILQDGELEVRGNFTFDEFGDIVRFESAERPWLGEERVEEALWIAEFAEHRSFAGHNVPTRMALRWELDGQTFPYLEAKLDLFETEVPRRFGAKPAQARPAPMPDVE